MFKFITNSIGKIFGTKYDRDIASYTPLVKEINEEFERLKSLSDDQLRQKTLEFRKRIAEHLAGIDEDIKNLNDESTDEKDFLRKEEIFKEVDKLKEERDKHLEDVLKEILPEAFATVKETCRRFMENESITVTATDHDREMAAHKNYVTISGDQATWQNSWTAAGAEITWNM